MFRWVSSEAERGRGDIKGGRKDGEGGMNWIEESKDV